MAQLVDIANADNYLRKAALANDPPSKTLYNPERNGIRCRSLAASLLPATAPSRLFLSRYKGLPFNDSRYQGGPQEIQGRVLCAYYDLGGE